MTDLLVLGSGIAGLSAAVRARRAGLDVAVLTKGALTWSATRYAQGGVAAALFEDDDSPELHGADTLTAGVGLCDTDAVAVLAGEGPTRVRELMSLGAHFDEIDGTLALGREGGHSVARVVHAGGDATGAEIERALVEALQASGADVYEQCLVTDLIVARRPLRRRARRRRERRRSHVQCPAHASWPPVAPGSALPSPPTLRCPPAMVSRWRCVRVWQSPTSNSCSSTPPRCIIRRCHGRCCRRRCAARARSFATNDGVAFMTDEHPLRDLAPRDVVARAISRRLNDRGLDHLWLDATVIHRLRRPLPHDLPCLRDGRSRPDP